MLLLNLIPTLVLNVFDWETLAEEYPKNATVRLKLTDTIPTEGFWLPNKALTQGLRGSRHINPYRVKKIQHK